MLWCGGDLTVGPLVPFSDMFRERLACMKSLWRVSEVVTGVTGSPVGCVRHRKRAASPSAHSPSQTRVPAILLQCPASSQPGDNTGSNAAEKEGTGGGDYLRI